MLPVSSGQRPTADYKFAYHFFTVPDATFLDVRWAFTPAPEGLRDP
jgi:hypothetical protein